MTKGGKGQIAGLFAAASLVWALSGLPSVAQESGGSAPAKTNQSAVDVQVDNSGALIPPVQRPAGQNAVIAATPGEDEADQPVSGGSAPQSGGRPAGGGAATSGGGNSGALDYVGWERMAVRAENATQNSNVTNIELDRIRSQLVDWRESLLNAQSANAARIATLRQQIDALGPAPADGVSETDEIANRRRALSDQLARLQAPGIAAEEAYRRADGLIGEIDRVLRERQADELLKLWPNPLYPGNWPEGLGALTLTARTLWTETLAKTSDRFARQTLADNLLLILPLIVFAIAVLWRGRGWMDRLIEMLRGPSSLRGRRLWDFVASLALIIVPSLGVIALAEALTLSDMLGRIGTEIAVNMGQIGLTLFAAIWLGNRAFPPNQSEPSILILSQDKRAQGRFLATALGVLLAIARLQRVAMEPLNISEAATSVLNLPIILVGAVILLRMGQLMIGAAASETGGGPYRQRVIGWLGRAAVTIGLIGPLLAAIGYIAAASALVFPAALSLGLLALLLLTQTLITDLYALVTRSDGDEQDALAPVLISFVLALATLPVFVLIWGARVSDLTELWTRFKEGFALGGTQISPTDFLLFAIVFAIGLSATRLLQGTLKTQVLPRTGMDQGAQNAMVSGLGYVGIFVAALAAIKATGIDLSGLAIVAGALSVGIGFGLQAVVSNFVSGIILLIERPISEGDWIEVGPVQGIVASISVRSTRIQTFDRSFVIVPNSDLISGRVTNWTRFSMTGRLIVVVPVPYTSDTRLVEKVLREIAEAQPLVLLSPPPVVALMGFTTEVMSFEMRMILRDVNFLVETRSEINHQIARRFAQEGIMFTNAHRDYLKLRADEAAAAAVDAAEWAAKSRGGRRALGRPQTPFRRGAQPSMTDLLFRDDAYQTECSAVVTGHTPEGGIIVDRTVFYATSGGQPGDSGRITWAGGEMAIATAVKVEGGSVALVPAEPRPMPPVGVTLHMVLDWARRHRLMRVHTALHLLSVVIPLPVTGGQIGVDRGRLDFDMPEPPGDTSVIEAAVNRLIDRDLIVTEEWISEAELLDNPGLVKTMSVAPPMGQGRIRLVRIGQIDLQPCGGTHVGRTSEIGRIEIGKIEKKGRVNRRVTLALA